MHHPRHLRHALAALAIVTASTMVLVGCSSPDENQPAAGSSVPAAEPGALPVTIDHKYGSTTISTQPARVAAMGVGDGDTLLALGITPTTIAPFADPTQRSAPWNEKLLGDAKPVILPNVSAEFGAQIAKALSTDPQLVTAVGAAPTREHYDTLSKAVPTIVRPAQYQDWQVPWEVQTLEIGKSVGLPDAASKKISEARQHVEALRAEHPELEAKTGVVVTGSPDGGVSIYGPGDGRAQTLADYGLNFPQALKSTITNGFYGSISAERLDLLDAADVVVVVDWSGANAKLKSDATWNRQRYVTQGRAVYLDQQVGSAMSVPTVLTVPWVADKTIGPISDAARKSTVRPRAN